MTTALVGGEVVSVTPRPPFTPGKDPVPIVQEAGWAPGPSGQVWKISPLPGFDPRTVQAVANRYTDYTIRPTHGHIQCCYFVAAVSQDDKGVQRKRSGVRKKIRFGVQGWVGTRAIGCTLCEFMSFNP